VISDYLDRQLITHLETRDRNEALCALVDLLEQAGKLEDKEAFYQAILHREKLVSTGVGMGVAIPHAKLSTYTDFFIAIGIHKGDGIEWNSLDHAPVRLVFMIGGPDNKQTEYLKLLSQLTIAIKDEKRRKKLMQIENLDDIIPLFKEL